MENHPYSDFINTILGGPTCGDNINARERTAQHLRNNDRAHAPPALRSTNVITFDESEIPLPCFGGEDLEDPNVPLVITLDIATYKVAKVLVDTGSTSNIISARALARMDIGRLELGRVASSLVVWRNISPSFGKCPSPGVNGKFPSKSDEACPLHGEGKGLWCAEDKTSNA